MNFGEILRELVEDKGLSQKELADELHMAPSTIGNYISQYRQPDFETLKMFATYFKVSTDYLLDYQHQQTRCHDEDHLLKVYRSLSPAHQAVFLDQGHVLLKHNNESKP